MRDSAWINRILRRDRKAEEQFVREFHPQLFRLLRYLSGDPEIAADLTQQALLNAWKSLPDFQGRSSLKTYLHRIAYHEYTHWLREKRDHAPIEAAMHLAMPPAESEWQRLILPEALTQLPEEQRAVFLLYYIQELSVTETADILNLPPGTVKSRLFAARQRLRALLEIPADEEASLSSAAPEVVSQNEGGPCA